MRSLRRLPKRSWNFLRIETFLAQTLVMNIRVSFWWYWHFITATQLRFTYRLLLKSSDQWLFPLYGRIISTIFCHLWRKVNFSFNNSFLFWIRRCSFHTALYLRHMRISKYLFLILSMSKLLEFDCLRRPVFLHIFFIRNILIPYVIKIKPLCFHLLSWQRNLMS